MPEPLGPPPRTVRYRDGRAWPIWLGRLFSLPYFLIGAVLFFAACGFCAWAAFGVDRPAKVISTHHHPGTSRSQPNWQASYRHEIDGHLFHGAGLISEQEFDRLNAAGLSPDDRTIIVRGIGAPPIYWERLIDPAHRWIWRDPLILALLAAVWCAFLFFQLRSDLLLPARQRRLCATGATTPGTIIGLEERPGRRRTTIHLVKYRFDFQEVEQTAQLRVSGEAFRKYREGDPITVLHPENAASPSIAYELCPYVCD